MVFPGEEADWIDLLYVYTIFQTLLFMSGFDSMLVLCLTCFFEIFNW